MKTTLTRDIHDSEAIRTHNSSNCAAADPRLKPRGHLDRAMVTCTFINNTVIGNNFIARCSMAGPWLRRDSGGKRRLCSGENRKLAAAVLSNIGRRLTLEGAAAERISDHRHAKCKVQPASICPDNYDIYWDERFGDERDDNNDFMPVTRRYQETVPGSLRNTVKPRLTYGSDHEQFGLRRFSEHKTSRMTYCVSSYEHASRQNVDKNKSHWTTF